MTEIKIREARFDEPAVQRLIAEAMAELSRLYGGSGDNTPVANSDFAPPTGAFFVAYAGDELLGCAGWRAHGADAELKRMFTVPASRGRGVAKKVLAAIEESARQRGCKRVILETGDKQPEAIAMYIKCGYERIDDFGFYAGEEGVLSFARVL